MGTDLVPQNGWQRSGTQPFVPFRCPPFLGTKKVPVFRNQHLCFGNRFFDFGASGMACSRSAAPTEAIARALPFHWLLADWPQVVILKEWFLQGFLRPSRWSSVDTWSCFRERNGTFYIFELMSTLSSKSRQKIWKPFPMCENLQYLWILRLVAPAGHGTVSPSPL